MKRGKTTNNKLAKKKHKFICRWRFKFLQEHIFLSRKEKEKVANLKKAFKKDGELNQTQLNYLKKLCYSREI